MSTVIPLIRAQLGNPAPPMTDPENYQPADQMIRDNLAAYIRKCFDASKRHRQTNGIDDRMVSALRAVRGEYDAQTLTDIKQFGGSEVYARITASKVRGVAALLREIYTAAERPWGLEPTPEPDLVGPSVAEATMAVMQAEISELLAAGTEPTAEMLTKRSAEIRETVTEARKKSAQEGLRARERVIDDLLWEGGFYSALWEFLLDIATFPFACIKGPVVRNKRVVKWQGKKPVVKSVPTMEWQRCSPFDTYFAPWAQSPQDGYIIHRQRTTRAGLQALIGLPSYDERAIRAVLSESADQIKSWWDYAETERADLEQRDSDMHGFDVDAVDKPVPMLEFHGPVSGKTLKEWGIPAAQVPDETQDLDITAYLIGTRVIGVRLNPHPAGFKPFYVDSFERVPGSIYGHAVPDLIEDIQGVANATLRALVNNLAIASGPMAWMNEDRMSPTDTNATKLWPWKVFRTTDSMSGSSNDKPMEFFQPDSNANTLLSVYEKFAQMADELSSLPRHMQGQPGGLGGAGRTASGMSMLIEAGNRTIKQTVGSIDTNVIEQVVEHLNIYLALLRPDVVLEGDISVVARGAAELVQRETLRMRRLEFLNITNNPMDSQIVGPVGRYNLLKEIARDLGLPINVALPQDLSKMAAQPAPQGQQVPNPQAPTGGPGGAPPSGEQPNPTQGVARPTTAPGG